MFGPEHDYKVGDDAWIYIGDHQGEMTKGAIVALLDLPNWSYRHYVIEVPSHIDPILEIRCCSSMRPSDPRVGRIADLLSQEFGEEREKCLAAARSVLELAIE